MITAVASQSCNGQSHLPPAELCPSILPCIHSLRLSLNLYKMWLMCVASCCEVNTHRPVTWTTHAGRKTRQTRHDFPFNRDVPFDSSVPVSKCTLSMSGSIIKSSSIITMSRYLSCIKTMVTLPKGAAQCPVPCHRPINIDE